MFNRFLLGLLALIIGLAGTAIYYEITFVIIFWILSAAGLIFIFKLKILSEKNKDNKMIAFVYKISVISLILFAISFTMIQGILISNSFNEDPDIVTDYLLVLGGGVKGEEPALILQDRLNKAIEYLNDHPEVIAIVSGGQGSQAEITEAEAMKIFLINNGIEADRIIKEDKATSTNENIIYTKKILEQLEVENEINLLTSEFHIFRAEYIAKSRGLKTYSLKSETSFWLKFNYLIREYFALIKTLVVDL